MEGENVLKGKDEDLNGINNKKIKLEDDLTFTDDEEEFERFNKDFIKIKMEAENVLKKDLDEIKISDNENEEGYNKCMICNIKMDSWTRQYCGKIKCDNEEEI